MWKLMGLAGVLVTIVLLSELLVPLSRDQRVVRGAGGCQDNGGTPWNRVL